MWQLPWIHQDPLIQLVWPGLHSHWSVSAASFPGGSDGTLVAKERGKGVPVHAYMEVGRFIAALEFVNHLGLLMWCKHQNRTSSRVPWSTWDCLWWNSARAKLHSVHLNIEAAFPNAKIIRMSPLPSLCVPCFPVTYSASCWKLCATCVGFMLTWVLHFATA